MLFIIYMNIKLILKRAKEKCQLV